MPGITPNETEVDLLTQAVSVDWIIKLIAADFDSADEALTAADLTFLAEGDGYAERTLTGGSWTITPGDPTKAVYADQEYTFTASIPTVYGYAYIDSATGHVRRAIEFDDGPYSDLGPTQALTITPEYTME